jgi:hypothetical protein
MQRRLERAAAGKTAHANIARRRWFAHQTAEEKTLKARNNSLRGTLRPR